MNRLLGLGRWIADQLRHAPVTLGYVAVLWLIGLVTGSLLHGPPKGLLDHVGAGLPSLASGYWWTPFTAGLWASSLGSYVGKTILLLALVAPAERRLGVARTALILVASQIGGELLGIGAIKLGSMIGEPWLSQLTKELDIGPATGAIGVGYALSFPLSVLWRRRLRTVLTVGVLLTALYSGHIQEVVRVGAAVVGIVMGLLLFGRSATARSWRASHRETRVLVAIVVATSALGGLLTALLPDPVGPMEPFTFLLAFPPPDASYVTTSCASHTPTGMALCRELLEERLYTQLPGIFVQIAPALLLLVVAEGLRRGRRLAWWIAVLFNALLLGLASWMLYKSYIDPTTDFTGPGDRIKWLVAAAEALLLPVATLVILFLTRRHVDQTADRRSAWALAVTFAGAVLAASAAYLQIGYALRDHFAPEPDFGGLLGDLPGRFLPGKLFDNAFLPTDLTGRLIFVYVFVVFWVVVLAALTTYFWKSRTTAEAGAAERARALLTEGGSTLSYMTTWPGNHYWFSADGRAAVAYRPLAGVAITLGDPYGAVDARDGAVAEFAAYCERRGWTPCFYSVTEEGRKAATELGWSSVQVAEDTVVPLAQLEFKGKKWQDVRTALNKAGKAEVTAEWWTYSQAPLEIVEQINAISEEWVADKGLPEMGFTLGGLDELDDDGVRCLVAVDASRRVHGVTSWMPVYQDGAVIGWTLDFMRRSTAPDAFRGVMEFLIASAALGFKEEGAEFLSLSGAPLARLERGEQPTALQRLLDFAGRTLEPVYGFRSLLNFKAKFQPEYQPLYMAYPDPAALPSIAGAIGRAYLPHLTAKQAFRLLQQFR